ncbi:ABC transporter ATP-binding protein [Dactylosporangium sp. AC04546]|uniref:ABC transporter ATP-binding protein n=1 Tax=Dactylosporangium sp. AC04546 TaxID=2862460 RepID=UPI001EDE7AD0|nr:ABC transporter ATP-binding protein [Dactylosporangium sp. AC04546]WVK78816.1 ABC transporter ATP-binding protein [Dactylosporangium sp. AC04546]
MSDVLAVDAVDLTKTFGPLTAVDHISLRVAQGEVYGVLGPNGAGKTTLLRMLFGLIRPDSGTLEVFGRSWPRDGVRTLDGVAGFIESPRFYPGLSGRRNLRLLAGLDGLPAATAAHRVDEVLDAVDLLGRDREKVRGYSFGMRQRLGVAAALLRDPRLLVLDEPANGLDPAGIRDMRALVKRLAGSGLTVLLSSHDMAEVEQICDDVTIMRTGQVVYHGSIATLRDRAPAQAHRLATTDDERAAALAAARGLPAEPADGGLAVRGDEAALDALIADVVGAGIGLRGLALSETPLEALFFMLTETAPDAPTADLHRAAATTGARR